jgi:hypothetical protein
MLDAIFSSSIHYAAYANNRGGSRTQVLLIMSRHTKAMMCSSGMKRIGKVYVSVAIIVLSNDKKSQAYSLVQTLTGCLLILTIIGTDDQRG